MRRYFPKISVTLMIMVTVFTLSTFFIPNTVNARCSSIFDVGCQIVEVALPGLVNIVLKIVSLFTGLAGVILNGVVSFTIVNMAENYRGIEAIDTAWGVVRDLANMGFIFVLLYAAIQTILGIGQDNQKLIVRTIVVAILINFSLFFTSVIIDISNVLALTFYDAIAPGAAESAGGINLTQFGLSNAFMDKLNLQNLYQTGNAAIINMGNIITIGIMGSIMLIIAGFVFFAVALLLLIRYVVLVLVLILSPIAFIASILPQMSKYRDQWWNALSGQAFFAPIYFMLTWITLEILGGVTKALGALPGDPKSSLSNVSLTAGQTIAEIGNETFAMFINFIVIIIFLIASLIIAKEWANKAGSGITGLTKWAGGFAGKTTFGLAAKGFRSTIGSREARIANDEDLKKRAREGDMGARLRLATANKLSRSSFDIRGSGLGGQLDAGSAKKGGFVQDQKDRAKAYEKYKPGKDETEKAIRAQKDAQDEYDKAVNRDVGKTAEHEDAEERLRAERAISTKGMTDEQIAARKARLDVLRDEIAKYNEDLAVKREVYRDSPTIKATRDLKNNLDEAAKKVNEFAEAMKKMAKASENREPIKVTAPKVFGRKIPLVGKINFTIPLSGYIPGLGGKDRANAIREAAKGESEADKLWKKIKKEYEEEEKTKTGSAPTSPPPPTSGGTPP
jgi:hypothetical protein